MEHRLEPRGGERGVEEALGSQLKQAAHKSLGNSAEKLARNCACGHAVRLTIAKLRNCKAGKSSSRVEEGEGEGRRERGGEGESTGKCVCCVFLQSKLHRKLRNHRELMCSFNLALLFDYLNE